MIGFILGIWLIGSIAGWFILASDFLDDSGFMVTFVIMPIISILFWWLLLIVVVYAYVKSNCWRS